MNTKVPTAETRQSINPTTAHIRMERGLLRFSLIRPYSSGQSPTINDLSYPQFYNQHRAGGNEVWYALVLIGHMRTDANFPIAADFHAQQRMFDSGDHLTASKYSCVVDERNTPFDSNRVLGKVFYLVRI